MKNKIKFLLESGFITLSDIFKGILLFVMAIIMTLKFLTSFTDTSLKIPDYIFFFIIGVLYFAFMFMYARRYLKIIEKQSKKD